MTIERSETIQADGYIGTRDELIAAGLVRADQFPGLPGHSATSQSFYDGKALERQQRGTWDERRIRVQVWGGKFKVLVGVPVEVQQRRQAAQNAAWHAQNAAREAEEEQAVQAYRMAIVDSLKATAGRRRDQRYCEFLLDAIFCGAELKEGPRRGGMAA